MSGEASREQPRSDARPDLAAHLVQLVEQRRDQLAPLAMLVGLAGVLTWAYWNSLCVMAGRWDDPLYSHGYVVPLFAALLLWLRRKPLRLGSIVDRWLGLGLLALGLGSRLMFTRTGYIAPELVTFVPSLAGVFLLVGGRELLRWAGPVVAFLVFMFPLPSVIREGVLVRLQYVATAVSTFVLQMVGVAAYAEGNRITVGQMQLGVEDACSGLRMATNLTALVIAILLISKRSWWDQVIIALSAVPIALAVNVIRIVATALYVLLVGGETSETFHTWAGFAMMPLAMGILLVEMALLSRLIIEDEDGAELATAGIGIRSRAQAQPATTNH